MEIRSNKNQPFRQSLTIFYTFNQLDTKGSIFSYPATIDDFHVLSVVCTDKVQEDVNNEKGVDYLVGIKSFRYLVSGVKSEQIWREDARHNDQPKQIKLVFTNIQRGVALTMFLRDRNMFQLSSLDRSSIFSLRIHLLTNLIHPLHCVPPKVPFPSLYIKSLNKHSDTFLKLLLLFKLSLLQDLRQGLKCFLSSLLILDVLVVG